MHQPSTPSSSGQEGTHHGPTLSSFEPIRFCTVILFWIICDQTNAIDAAVARSTTFGSMEGRAYTAALGADTVRGMSNKPPFTCTLSGLTSASTAIVSQAAMDANDGGWALLFGSSPVSATQLRLAIDEDWHLYSERNHTTEQVAYIVFQQP